MAKSTVITSKDYLIVQADPQLTRNSGVYFIGRRDYSRDYQVQTGKAYTTGIDWSQSLYVYQSMGGMWARRTHSPVSIYPFEEDVIRYLVKTAHL